MTCPDPEGKCILPDGVEMPMGKGINAAVGQSSLLYNEYPFGSLLLMHINVVKKAVQVVNYFSLSALANSILS